MPLMIFTMMIVCLFIDKRFLFMQERAGLYGKPFLIYKFKTMKDKFDDSNKLLPDNQRITKLGCIIRKLSLDEFPQLFNVLSGEMSLVGPRPLLVKYIPRYNKFQIRRHEVRPGITGWAQVNGRNAISWEKKFELDVWYVDNYNFCLDLKILWLTCVKVLKRRDINSKDNVLMTEFRGNS